MLTESKWKKKKNQMLKIATFNRNWDGNKYSNVYQESNDTIRSTAVSYRWSQFTILLVLHLICHSIHISNRCLTSIQFIYRFRMVQIGITGTGYDDISYKQFNVIGWQSIV